MEFSKENPSCKFTIPDRPTVRQQMEYFSATVGAEGVHLMMRYWMGARALIKDWECEALPNHKVDLETIDNPEQTELIIWAALHVKRFMDGLDNIPKN